MWPSRCNDETGVPSSADGGAHISNTAKLTCPKLAHRYAILMLSLARLCAPLLAVRDDCSVAVVAATRLNVSGRRFRTIINWARDRVA